MYCVIMFIKHNCESITDSQSIKIKLPNSTLNDGWCGRFCRRIFQRIHSGAPSAPTARSAISSTCSWVVPRYDTSSDSAADVKRWERALVPEHYNVGSRAYVRRVRWAAIALCRRLASKGTDLWRSQGGWGFNPPFAHSHRSCFFTAVKLLLLNVIMLYVFSYLSPKIWNNLPLEIRLSSTYHTFKIRLKGFLFT